MNLQSAPLAVLCRQLRLGSLDLHSYIGRSLSLLEELEPELHGFVPGTVKPEEIRARADFLLSRYPSPAERPPLFGVLVGIKDLFNVTGLPTRAGSKLSPEVFQDEQSTLVDRLLEQGAIVLGKTVSTEFAYFNPGPTTNPHNKLHSPGGSSSGSAAVVAAGICPLATGTQTIASVTRPAAYCGIYGYKPGFGRMPMAGIFPFAPAVDHPGLFTQDWAGMQIAAQALMPDWKNPVVDPDCKGCGRPLRVGIPSPIYLRQSSPELLQIFSSFCSKLSAARFVQVQTALFSRFEELKLWHQDLIAYGFYLTHRQLYPRFKALYSPASQELYSKGSGISEERIAEIELKQAELRLELSRMEQELELDYWFSPAATDFAPVGLESTGSPLISLPWTFCGSPTLAVPIGKNRLGLPWGLQIAAPRGADESLFAAQLREGFLT